MISSATVKSTFKDAAKKQTGDRRRDFMAKVAEDYFNGFSSESINISRMEPLIVFKLAYMNTDNLGFVK
ncbi:hypothetical protein D0A34_10335 [Microcoleus vaginatus PCC 9802]|uniref:hypothetical protein n=1 Tax=Microcoleus vaginatus TaxID=119532 RepID=UPI00020D2C66|nr:hypothetical protein MicvaDRAFT_1617 [Microcoleus vaginatus FGP-2]UNU19212.1 hypothetical protein D0A34_10335 [Microcoleus vaginatus PCC 9802]